MSLIRSILFAFALVVACSSGLGAGHEELGAAASHAGETAASHAKGAEHHGLPPAAPAFQIGPLQFTSSTVITWIVAAFLIIVAQVGTRRMDLVPSGLQNFLEWLVEGLYNFFGEILGAELVRKSFWFFCSIFLFILATNWMGLIPGVGTVGYGHTDASGHFVLTKPFLRGGHADLNMTLAMSLTFFFLWLVWAWQALGGLGILKHIFWGGGGQGIMGVFMIIIFGFVGLIEVISIAFRPVSLSFRLYGNIFAGENILEAMMHLGGVAFGWLLPLPFYFLELLVGLVQALVFALLTAVFTALMCTHEDGAHDHDKAHKHEAAH